MVSWRVNRLSRWRVILVASSLVSFAACSGDVTRPTATAGTLPPGAVPVPPPGSDDPSLAACPSADVIASFPIEITFAPEITNQPLVCTVAAGSADLTQRQLFVYAALLAMDKLRFTRPLPWTNESLWAWFAGLRPRLSVRTSGGASCGPCFPGRAQLNLALPVDTPVNWHNIIYFLGGLAHEARHIEIGGHVCGVRDRRVADMHAFGVHNSVYTWVADYVADGIVTQADREAARIWACQQRNSAFCDDRCSPTSSLWLGAAKNSSDRLESTAMAPPVGGLRPAGT